MKHFSSNLLMADQPQSQQQGGSTPPPPPPSQQNPASDQPQGPPPPRPGDMVPEGGLDPTQVFAVPPMPPPPPPTQQAGQGGAQPPQDSGIAPPPAGTPVDPVALKAKGYDDEDIRVLGIVGNYRFGSLSVSLTAESIAVPQHPETRFDEKKFILMLAGSISLEKDEKWRIIQAIPKLSQFQIDELFRILDEEKKKFAELSPKHLLQLQKLEYKAVEDWRDLQSLYVQQGAKQKESQQADEIRKQLGL